MATPYPLSQGLNRQLAAAGQASPGAGPATYVLLPRSMVEDLRRAPGAIGAYALIGRLYLVSGAPVPLSPGDLQAYDPALSYGGARRALDSLALSSYALRSEAAGRKSTYVPTWGLIKGSVSPWEREAPHLGRPRHVGAVRLDDRLLDLCMGRLRPSAAHRAIVDRYVARPLLGLRDVGAYALALTGLRHSSENLHGMGLLAPDGAPIALPDDMTVLAIASQRPSATAPSGLTPEGLQHVGFTPRPAPAPSGTAIFLVPPDMTGGIDGELIGGGAGRVIGDLSGRVIGGDAGRVIGDLSGRVIGRVIGSEEAQAGLSDASQSQKEGLVSVFRRSHGITDVRNQTNQPTNTSGDRLASETDPHTVGGGGGEIIPEAEPPTAGPEQAEQVAAPHQVEQAEQPDQGEQVEQVEQVAQEAPQQACAAPEQPDQGEQVEQVAQEAPQQACAAPEQPDQGDQGEQVAQEAPQQACAAPEQPDQVAPVAPVAPVAQEAPQQACAAPEQPATGCPGQSEVRQRGRAVAPAQARAEQSPHAVESAQTESERLLRAIGVRMDMARKFADRPAAQVERVIAQAQGRQDVRDVAAWAISVLKALPPDAIPRSPGDNLPPPPFPIYDHPALTTDQRSDWLMAYHKAETPAQKQALLARFEQEHPFPKQGLPLFNKPKAPTEEDVTPMDGELEPSPYLLYVHKGITQKVRELWLGRFFKCKTAAERKAVLREFEQAHPLIAKGDPGSGKEGHSYWWIRPGPNRLKVDPGTIFLYEGITNVERAQWALRLCRARTDEERYAVLVDFERAYPPSEDERPRVAEERPRVARGRPHPNKKQPRVAEEQPRVAEEQPRPAEKRRRTGDEVFGPRTGEPPAVELMLRRRGPTDEQRAEWIAKFKLASSLMEQVDVLCNFEQEYPE